MPLKSGSTATSRLVWRNGANSASGVTEAASEPPPPAPLDPRGWQDRTDQNVGRRRRRGVQMTEDAAVHIAVAFDGDGGEQDRYGATGGDGVQQ